MEATVVKGLIDCLRIRLEVGVLGQKVLYVRKRRKLSSRGLVVDDDSDNKDGGGRERAPDQREQNPVPATGTPGSCPSAPISWGMLALTQVLEDKDGELESRSSNKKGNKQTQEQVEE